MTELPEFYIATDVETDGPIPGPYGMLSLGMSVVGRPELSFYSELKQISGQFSDEALAVSGLDRGRLIKKAPHPEAAMKSAHEWVNKLRPKGRPVFLAAPAVWDGMFIHWYFIRFVGQSPFGQTGSGVDLRSYWMGLKGCEWRESRKEYIKEELALNNLSHTHNAGEDAAELATIFASVLKKASDR